MDVLEPDLLERELRELGGLRAPRRFAERALAACGVGDHYTELPTPIGTFYAVWNSTGVKAVLREHPDTATRSERFPARHRFDLSDLTPFEQAVLRKTLEIPSGEVRSYGWVAREIGHARAVRAVGSALARNPVPILIPCHRVVRSDGVIGRYGAGGPEAKRAMLVAEGADPDGLEELARRGVRFVGSRTTAIFCNPTCHNARRIQAANRALFHDEREATAAGYRPCAHCRPAAVAA